MKILAIIPARAGSKGVKGKNKLLIAGSPLVTYSIEEAILLGDDVDLWISSDDTDVIDICRQYPQINIHQRKEEHADDASPITDTIKEVLLLAESKSNVIYDAILLLQPTSPLRTSIDIQQAINLLFSDNTVNSVVSVCEMDDLHPARMYWKEGDKLESILPEYETTRRQDIPPAHYRNGCIYLVRRETFVNTNKVMVKPMLPYIMPSSWLLNIDDPRDVMIAEVIIPAWKQNKL
jgi:CMP-N-acetylneuraminic acid synthetase